MDQAKFCNLIQNKHQGLKIEFFKVTYIISTAYLLGWVKSLVIFCYVAVCSAYLTWPKQFKPWEVTSDIGSIVIVGALIHSALFHPMCDLSHAD